MKIKTILFATAVALLASCGSSKKIVDETPTDVTTKPATSQTTKPTTSQTTTKPSTQTNALQRYDNSINLQKTKNSISVKPSKSPHI